MKFRKTRIHGTNPRALGTNPRALGTNPLAKIRNKWASRKWKRKQSAKKK